MEHLSAEALLAEALHAEIPTKAVVVAADLGATKRAERLALRLGLPVAISIKSHVDAEHVRVNRIIGDVQQRVPIIV